LRTPFPKISNLTEQQRGSVPLNPMTFQLLRHPIDFGGVQLQSGFPMIHQHPITGMLLMGGRRHSEERR
jgi:hypothetical protein